MDLMILLAALFVAQPAPSLAGGYLCSGIGDDGKPYGVALDIMSYKDGYLLMWVSGNGKETGRGLGIRVDDVLSAAFTDGKGVGIVRYAIEADGVLSGTWWAGGGLRPERCQQVGETKAGEE